MRQRFVRIAHGAPKLFEVFAVDKWKAPNDGSTRVSIDVRAQAARWACLVDMEGFAPFSSRIPVLLHTGRPVLYVARAGLTWYEDSERNRHAIRPWVHFIPVRNDLADLASAARWVQEHPAEAAAIGARARQHALRYLSLDAATTYLGRQLAAFSGRERLLK